MQLKAIVHFGDIYMSLSFPQLTSPLLRQGFSPGIPERQKIVLMHLNMSMFIQFLPLLSYLRKVVPSYYS